MHDTNLLQLITDDFAPAQQLLELLQTESLALHGRDMPLLEDILARKQALIILLEQHGWHYKGCAILEDNGYFDIATVHERLDDRIMPFGVDAQYGRFYAFPVIGIADTPAGRAVIGLDDKAAALGATQPKIGECPLFFEEPQGADRTARRQTGADDTRTARPAPINLVTP